jgi:serine/threonine protein kinase
LRQPIPFGKYYLLERVNVGGMAEVFKAKATGVEGFERMVAVKRILPSIAEDEEFITMFIDEAKIAVQLTHANVAQIFDLGKVDDSYFIALEYVHGKDLRAIFNRARTRGEQIPVPMACYAIMKLCEGLDYAHNKRDAAGQFLNLVHRDVSPQNILVSYEGEVKIIDFGIAKAAGKAGRTQAGILKGKFGYMSPEQVQGVEIDRRSDVFGVGICLYELLTSERLFVGESDFATLEKVRNVDIMPPSTYNRRVPEELEQIVLKALARDRTNRHQTAMQLHDELQGFMYSSGNFFGRRDLSMYMHRAFAEEIERENSRDQEYAAMAGPADSEDVTGLNAFDEIDPVSAVSALQAQPSPMPPPAPRPRSQSPYASAPPKASSPPQPGAPPGRQHKSTLLGLPAAVVPPAPSTLRPPSAGRISVPPLIPRPQSIPPSHVPPSAPATVGGAAAQPPRLDMDWDDEELSTQIYDRPEDRTPAGPQASGADGYGSPSAPSGSYPPALGGAPAFGGVPTPTGGFAPVGGTPGAPSPFGASFPGSAGTGTTVEVVWPPPGTATERRPMQAAALAVVAIIGVIVAALWIFRHPAPGTVHLTVTPGDAAVTMDGKAIVGSSPFVVNQVVPSVQHEVIVSKTGYRSWSTQFELQAGETMQLPSVNLEGIESGFALDSVPSGATVFVDSKRLQQATPVRVADLGPGDHQIRLEAQGYSPWESQLHVTPGTVLDLPTAQLIAHAETEAPRGSAYPSSQAAKPPVAPTAPRVARATPPVMSATRAAPPPRPTPAPAPEPEAQEEAPAPPKAAPAESASGGTGTLRVQTRPWSKVLVDGRMLGTTPLMNVPLSAGHHTLTFVNDDFGIRKSVKVQIEAGQVLTQVLTLTD